MGNVRFKILMFRDTGKAGNLCNLDKTSNTIAMFISRKREYTAGTSCTRSVLVFIYREILRVLNGISRVLYCGYCEYSQYFGVQYCGVPPYFKYSRVLYCGYWQVLTVSRPLVLTASTQSTRILSLCTVYLEYEVYLDQLCTVSILPFLFCYRN